MKMKQLHPVLDTDALDMLKMLAVVCYHNQFLSFGCTSDKKVKVLNSLPCIPQSYSLFGKLVNSFGKWDNGYFVQEVLDLLEILFCPITFISTHYQFCNNNIIYITKRFAHSIKFVGNFPVPTKESDTYTSVEHIPLHSSMSILLEVLILRISSTISSAERLSFQTPQNRLAQPSFVSFFASVVSLSSFTIELLSKEIRFNLSLLFKFFNSPQYGTDEADVDVMFIIPDFLIPLQK